MNKKKKIAVIGAGHGGKAMAADLAIRGFDVFLFNRTQKRISAIQERGGILLKTEENREVFAPMNLVTTDIEEVLREVNLVMVVIPASGHRNIAKLMAPFLQDNHIVLLNPGRTGGVLEFKQVLNECENPDHPIICEAETFLFAARSTGPAQVTIFRTKFSVPLAALPSTRTKEALELIDSVYPYFISAPNILHTSLNNMGAIFHPALTLLNAGWIEATKGNFEFYMDGVTPATARVLEALDRERVTVAASMGVRVQSANTWLDRAYGAQGENLHNAMHNNEGYEGIKAPNRLHHRYIFEDVPYSLVPMALLGQQYGVETNTIHAIVCLANIIHNVQDHWRQGRTLECMGIKGLSVAELHRYVETGVR